MRNTIIKWAGVALVSAVCLVIGVEQGNAATAPAATTTTTLTVPAFCLNPTATHRTYPMDIPAGVQFARSGEHGHGNLTCIVFMTKTYSKTEVIDQATGGYKMGPLGLDFWYNDCSIPPERFPPNKIDNGPNDCAESWGSGEGHWVFVTGPDTGQSMIPGSTP